MDLDGNGVITMYEMQYFYEEQIRKMEDLGMETLAFEDCLCQVRILKTLMMEACYLSYSGQRRGRGGDKNSLIPKVSKEMLY